MLAWTGLTPAPRTSQEKCGENVFRKSFVRRGVEKNRIDPRYVTRPIRCLSAAAVSQIHVFDLPQPEA